jgi:hypothetical protein
MTKPEVMALVFLAEENFLRYFIPTFFDQLLESFFPAAFVYLVFLWISIFIIGKYLFCNIISIVYGKRKWSNP